MFIVTNTHLPGKCMIVCFLGVERGTFVEAPVQNENSPSGPNRQVDSPELKGELV
jgi:hypothetical protein